MVRGMLVREIEGWAQRNGDDRVDETAVEAVKGVDIDRVVVLDGGSGKGVQNAINQRVQGALGTLEGVSSAFGVDIQSVIQGAAGKISSPEGDE